jgi:N-acetylglucosaminyldiphosphoundecaprenol N-acetyl-beta-D-mannosaminyltransferase
LSASFQVLGVRVNAVQIPDVVDLMGRWIREGATGHYIAVTGMHGIMEAQQNQRFKRVLNEATLVVPDGMPLVWLGRWQGSAMRRRVYGPELMEAFCHSTRDRYCHFFYGGAPGVPERLAQVFQHRYGIRVGGTYSPPFRTLTPEEGLIVCSLIQAASPDVLWVGLSTPKQESWMFDYRHRLRVPVMVGVGAAFDFATRRTKQAPPWMREHGLEWLFRLLTEPRRLWRRYLIYGSKFVWKVTLEICGIKRFN